MSQDAALAGLVGMFTSANAGTGIARWDDSTIAPLAAIRSIDSVREHLQCAIELEHATLPPYLCPLYSLDRDRHPVAAEVMESVFVEEMVHLTLAANLLSAVGGAGPTFESVDPSLRSTEGARS